MGTTSKDDLSPPPDESPAPRLSGVKHSPLWVDPGKVQHYSYFVFATFMSFLLHFL